MRETGTAILSERHLGWFFLCRRSPIIRGQLRADGRFYADEVLLKCPTRYEDQLPEQAEEA